MSAIFSSYEKIAKELYGRFGSYKVLPVGGKFQEVCTRSHRLQKIPESQQCACAAKCDGSLFP